MADPPPRKLSKVMKIQEQIRSEEAGREDAALKEEGFMHNPNAPPTVEKYNRIKKEFDEVIEIKGIQQPWKVDVDEFLDVCQIHFNTYARFLSTYENRDKRTKVGNMLLRKIAVQFFAAWLIPKFYEIYPMWNMRITAHIHFLAGKYKSLS